MEEGITGLVMGAWVYVSDWIQSFVDIIVYGFEG